MKETRSKQAGRPGWSGRWPALGALFTVYLVSLLAPIPAFEAWTRGYVCPLRALSGIPCPTCGLSRAFLSIGHGDFTGAIRLHALSPLLYGAGLAWIAVLGSGARLRYRAVTIGLAGLLLAHWAWRITDTLSRR